jgi:hypothetical protein
MADRQCKHEGCFCLVDESEEYCSKGCKEGSGCDHAGCECDREKPDTTVRE